MEESVTRNKSPMAGSYQWSTSLTKNWVYLLYTDCKNTHEYVVWNWDTLKSINSRSQNLNRKIVQFDWQVIFEERSTECHKCKYRRYNYNITGQRTSQSRCDIHLIGNFNHVYFMQSLIRSPRQEHFKVGKEKGTLQLAALREIKSKHQSLFYHIF